MWVSKAWVVCSLAGVWRLRGTERVGIGGREGHGAHGIKGVRRACVEEIVCVCVCVCVGVGARGVVRCVRWVHGRLDGTQDGKLLRQG
jgi:hypothetical protein